MSPIKTKIRKFLWFDITPRRELYAELKDCYGTINCQSETINDYDNELDMQSEKISALRAANNELTTEALNLQRTIWEYEEQIHQLQETLDDLCSDDECEDCDQLDQSY